MWEILVKIYVRKIYVRKTENRIRFKIKTVYYLELLTLESMNLFRSTKNKITKDKNRENIPYLENMEVILIHKLK